jgi:tRNA(Ile)-lysidine synthase
VILPSEPREQDGRRRSPGWSADHLRLHRHLLRHPQLLPRGAGLLVAVSGGQDSMALIGLLQDLRRLHGWSLHLWHGDHGWRPEASEQARGLAGWAEARELPLLLEQADPAPAGEAEARHWRYQRLEAAAHSLGRTHVVTGHTADDRAETVLLHLARGSHRRGTSSLRPRRPLSRLPGTPWLCRPLLGFGRSDTLRICQRLNLPIWLDSSNSERRFSRNRVRAEVLPVLEALHPGAACRIAAQAERLAEEADQHQELVNLALAGLRLPPSQAEPGSAGLHRPPLAALSPATRRRLLEAWLAERLGIPLAARSLEQLSRRLGAGAPAGSQALPAGWRLHWDRATLVLIPPARTDG